MSKKEIMFKYLLVSLSLLFSSLVFGAESSLPKELEDAVKAKCQAGCAVLSIEEMNQLQASVQALAEHAYAAGKAEGKTICNKTIKD